MPYRIGFDIGGTFTDLIMTNPETGERYREKVPSTPEDFAEGPITGITALLDEGVSPADVERVAHGTTVATNAMLEREGATTGLLTTEGFSDLIAIGREKRQKLYDHSPEKPPTFAERRHRYGVPERITSDGEEKAPLDEAAVRRVLRELDDEVDSLAVSLLHAYRNDTHEREIAAIAREEVSIPVTLSTEVMPEINEYERTLSTVINAYVAPIVDEYVATLRSRLLDLAIEQKLYLMQANGGVVASDGLDGRQLRLMTSGPAAGVLGAKRFAAASSINNLITLDMGGTSADAAIVEGGSIVATTNGEIERIPLLYPQVDIRAIGSGGGSIAWLDDVDVLRVGPKSAGATPGPACYGRGGNSPTVTDAALHLGYLDPKYFLGGEMELDADRATAVLEDLADSLDMDVTSLSEGIMEIATTHMTQAIREITVERGLDPRDFVLTCFGGAGPMFATRLATALDIERTLIPPSPGILSATGLLTADEQFDYSLSRVNDLASLSPVDVRTIFEHLEADAVDAVEEGSTLERSVDLRYAGQSFEHTVPLDGDVTVAPIEALEAQFHETYREIHGYAHEDEPVTAVTWRLRVVNATGDVVLPSSDGSPGSLNEAVKGERPVYLAGAHRTATVYDRARLGRGDTVDGPAILEEAESTAVVGPNTTATVDAGNNVLLDRS